MLLTVHVMQLAFAVGLAVLLRALDAAPWSSGFAVGLIIGATPVFWMVFRDAQGLTHRLMGAQAEEWTAVELGKLSRRWAVFHDIELERVNVDHVVVGPGRFYAVETKWLGSPPAERHLARLAGQAVHRADALARELASRGETATLTPLLILWGPGAREVAPEGFRRLSSPRVTVAIGQHSDTWLPRLESASDGSDPSPSLLSALASWT